MYAVRQLLHLIVWVYLLVVFGRLILDWIRVFARDWRPKGVMLVVAETVYTLTDPPLRALRKVVLPLRIGGGPRPGIPAVGGRALRSARDPLGLLSGPHLSHGGPPTSTGLNEELRWPSHPRTS